MKKSVKSSAMRAGVKKAGLRAGVAVIGLVAAWAAQAQEAQNESGSTLAPIVLQGEGEQGGTGPVRGYVAKQTTTGSKTDTPLNEVPQAVSVVGREELDDRGVVNKVDEALRYTSGVVAQPYGTDPDTDWFYIRGFDASQTGLYMDGLNLFGFGFGNFQIDPFMLERVDVLKGPASVLYGGSNPGGIIDLVRKRPTDDPYYYTEIGINSNGNAFTGFDFSDKLGDSGVYSYRLTGKISGGEGYTDYTNDIRGFIMPQLTISPDDATKLTVYAYAAGLNQRHTGNGFLPYAGTVVDGPFGGKISRRFFPGEPDIDNGHYDQQMLGYELEHEFDGGWKVTSNFRYGHLDKWEHFVYPYLYAYADGTDPNDLNRINFSGDTGVDSIAWDNRVENEFDIGGATHKIMAGIDYRYYRIKNIQNSTFGASTIDPTDPVYGLPQLAPGPLYDEVATLNQLGLYVQDQIRFGDGWLVTLNGRYDFIHSDFNDKLVTATSPDDSYTDSDRAFSGRIGLAYEFSNGLTPYISAATFFNPLIGVSGAGPLKPEEGEQYEAGIKYEPTFFDGSLTASVFHINKENYTIALAGPPYTKSQLGEVESRGFELEGKANINENWKLLASLTYTDVETTKNPANPAWQGKTPYIIPDWTASLWADYTVTTGALEGLSLGAGLRYKGESWADELNTLEVPSSTVVDAAIRYKKDDWTASLNVTNVFDKTYVESCGGIGACGYGDARTFTVKLAKTW